MKEFIRLLVDKERFCGNIQLTNGKFHATEHAVVVTPLNDNDSIWLYFQLNRLNLNRFATGQAQPGLSVDVIQQIKTNIPTLPEQQKIADCLSTWDDSIENGEWRVESF
ncbi:restriction endonuclease subunit S [Francisella hispaniensis]|uniref:restriction endonuclease subunit S n=1 Tax=Francisella hispaniensis TaxID=622488 RepID=UPI00190413D1|nr:restriction endonuclease subunit S [Francisella hispaniensis]MBK2356583.1 restriction endonuclease subunit S [Francisella hispaniensis]